MFLQPKYDESIAYFLISNFFISLRLAGVCFMKIAVEPSR